MIRRAILALLIVQVVASAMGCATITSGTSETIEISANTRAAVKRNGVILGYTDKTSPLKIALKRSSTSEQLTIEADGFETQNLTLKSKINGAFFGNILLGGLLGSSIDLSTGAVYTYAPDKFDVLLKSDVDDPAANARGVTRRLILLAYDDVLAELAVGKGRLLDPLLLKLGPAGERALGRWRAAALDATPLELATMISQDH